MSILLMELKYNNRYIKDMADIADIALWIPLVTWRAAWKSTK